MINTHFGALFDCHFSLQMQVVKRSVPACFCLCVCNLYALCAECATAHINKEYGTIYHFTERVFLELYGYTIYTNIYLLRVPYCELVNEGEKDQF